MANVKFTTCRAGLFSYLGGVAEWCYHAEHGLISKIILQDNDYYSSGTQSLFSLLFEKSSNGKLLAYTDKYEDGTILTHNYPTQTNPITAETPLPYVYCKVETYKQKILNEYRLLLFPILQQYFRPLPHIQTAIDNIADSFKGHYVIGIHVRQGGHYNGFDKDLVECVGNDIREIMKDKDPNTTLLFISTLLQPIINALSGSYKIIFQKYLRQEECGKDWNDIPPIVEDAERAIIDVWSLSKCNEVWGGSSNMMIFAGCLNPKMPLNLLPSLSSYDGN